MRCEIESDGEALLAGGEVPPIKGVRLLGRREARVLADRPGALDIHRGVGAAEIGRLAGDGAEMRDIREIVLGEEALYGDALGGLPESFALGACEALPLRPIGCHRSCARARLGGVELKL